MCDSFDRNVNIGVGKFKLTSVDLKDELMSIAEHFHGQIEMGRPFQYIWSFPENGKLALEIRYATPEEAEAANLSAKNVLLPNIPTK